MGISAILLSKYDRICYTHLMKRRNLFGILVLTSSFLLVTACDTPTFNDGPNQNDEDKVLEVTFSGNGSRNKTGIF